MSLEGRTVANATSNTRITVAFVNERVTGLANDIAILTGVVTNLATLVANAQNATPAPVAEVVNIASAPKARKATARKAKATAPKAVPVADGADTLTIEQAQALVEVGEDPWKLKVHSTTGKVVPFGVVLRALKAQARAEGKTEASTTTAPVKRVSKASKAKASLAAPAEPDAAERKRVLALGGKALADLAEQGDASAAWEIARRAAKRAAK